MRKVPPKILFAFSCFFIFLLSLYPVSDTDFGWHLRTGEYIYNFREVPKDFLFSFASNGKTYTHYSWAPELLIYYFYKSWGFWGVSFFYGLVLTASVLLIAKTCLLFAENRFLLSFLFVLTPLVHVSAGGRTIAFGLLFFSLVYYLFVRFRKFGGSAVWLIPGVFLLWANFHASFAVGLVVLAFLFTFHVLENNQKRNSFFKLALVLGFSVLATLINPNFTNVWSQTIFTTMREFSSLQNVNPGWLSPLAMGKAGVLYIILIVLLSTIILFFRNLDLSQKILILSFFALTIVTIRFLFGLIVVLAPALYLLTLEIKQRLKTQVRQAIAIKIAVVAFFSTIFLLVVSNIAEMAFAYSSFNNYVSYLLMYSPNKKLFKDWSPEGYSFFERNFRNKNALADANWAGLFVLNNSQAKVFYYGAMDNIVISEKPFPFEYLSIVNATGNWKGKLDEYEVEVVFLPSSYPVVEKLKHNSNWETAFEDKSSTILVKN